LYDNVEKIPFKTIDEFLKKIWKLKIKLKLFINFLLKNFWEISIFSFYIMY
jgi:hypothetical protein